MVKTLGVVLVSILAVCLFLFLLWKIIEAFHYAGIRREAKARENSRYRSVCRWSVDSEGNTRHIRIRVPRED